MVVTRPAGALRWDRRQGLLGQDMDPGRRRGKHEVVARVLRRTQVDHVEVSPTKEIEPARVPAVARQRHQVTGKPEAIGGRICDRDDLKRIVVGEVGGFDTLPKLDAGGYMAIWKCPMIS